MKKLFAVLLLICMIFSMTQVLAQNTTGYVTADVLNVRSQGIVADYSIVLGQLPYGSKVKIIGTDGDWYKIDFNGMAAFVKGEYISLTPLNGVQTQSLPSRAGVNRVKGQAIVDFAKTFIGVPYVYGGTSPLGFDCSGLVYYVYKNFGVDLYRTAHQQSQNGVIVDRSELEVGDIILFSRDKSYINHVGIYVGAGEFIHAPQTGRNVEITSMSGGYYDECYFGARRIFTK